MTYSFNLIDQPWIPCMQPNGQMVEYGIKNTLNRASELREVQGDTPLETAALYRLLLAVLHSALRGPRSQSEWAKWWGKGNWKSKKINDYLAQWYDRFDLFDEKRPFYQMKDLRVKRKSIISLVFEMASGNNAVLFDHHTEIEGTSLPAKKTARTMIVAQTFGLAGLSGLKQNFTDSPWTRGIIFLVKGDNLFQTLCLNLLCSSEEYLIPAQDDDQPEWETEDPYQPVRQIPKGYLDYLTWQNRRVLLIPEGNPIEPKVRSIMFAPGLRLDNLVLDPMKHYRKDEKYGNLVLRFNEERALWRDSSALFRVNNPQNTRPPEIFHQLATIFENGFIKQSHLYHFMALGMANDQAKVEFFRHEYMPLPLNYLNDDEMIGSLDEALEMVEKCNLNLRDSINKLAILLVSPKDGGKKWNEISPTTKKTAAILSKHWAIERYFWGELELPFLKLLADLPYNPNALTDWKDIVIRTAWRAFERAETMCGESATAFKAAVKARSWLAYGLKELASEK